MDMKVSRMVTVIVTILRSRSALGVGCPLGKGVGNLPMVIVFVVGCGFEPARVQRNAFVVVLIVVTLIDIIQLMFIGKTDAYIPVRENQQGIKRCIIVHIGTHNTDQMCKKVHKST